MEAPGFEKTREFGKLNVEKIDSFSVDNRIQMSISTSFLSLI